MNSLDLIRKHYQLASTDLEELEDLWELVKDYSSEDEEVLFAYKASARALQAKDSWVPHKKWQYINEAMEMFQQALAKNPSHIEIRFLRLTVQQNTPGLLDLSEDIEEDTSILVEHLPNYEAFNLDQNYANFMLAFLEKHELLDQETLDKLTHNIASPS